MLKRIQVYDNLGFIFCTSSGYNDNVLTKVTVEIREKGNPATTMSNRARNMQSDKL